MNNNKLRSMLAVCLIVMLGGCATMEYVPIDRSQPESVQSHLSVGDTVHVRLQNGDEWQFRVVALEPDAIVSRDARIAYKDIDLLEVKTLDYKGTAKTAAAVGALALVFIAAAVIDAELDEDEEDYCDSNGVGRCIPR
jgi:hypothetical protein